jgi:predicted transport protein
MELSFGQVAYDEHFDGFMRHYLTIKTGKIPRIRDVYKAFKAYSKEPEISDLGVDELVKDIYLFSTYFCAMALGKEKDKGLAEAFRDLRDLKVDVAYPFLLELYHDYKNGSLTKQELIEVVRLVESYVFRRVVCNIPPNSLNKTFATFGRFLRKEKYVESVKANFQLLPSYRRFPNDNEFERDIKVRDLYNFRSRSYWLRRLENYRRKEVVVVPEYTIEHIMPQNENLSLAWQNDLGHDWKTVQKTWLHTLGNLTLTGYNPEYSDRPFCEKRLMEGGFKDSPLQLNKDVKETEIWNEKAINRRADRLAKIATKVWIMPDLSKEIVDKYSDISKRTSGFRIEDHIQLSHSSAMRPVFEILRKDILNIDPVVTEEFLKLYVAYKAETNFTDVVPQANALRVTLNLPFQNIDDPRRICKDVSNVGRWGNGDVEFKLSSVEEIPYAISLIEQSFEYQMGNGKEE